MVHHCHRENSVLSIETSAGGESYLITPHHTTLAYTRVGHGDVAAVTSECGMWKHQLSDIAFYDANFIQVSSNFLFIIYSYMETG